MLINMLLSRGIHLVFFYSEFHKQCWTLRGQPTGKQVETMRRDGINGGPNFLSWFRDHVTFSSHLCCLTGLYKISLEPSYL